MNTSFRLFTRIVFRNREAYALKIVASSLALAITITIVLFSLHEFGFDRFHKHADKVFRVIQKTTDENYNGNRLSVKIPGQIVDILNGPRYRDSLVISRVKIMHGVNVIANDQPVADQTIHAVDPAIEQILSLNVVSGDIKTFTADNGVSAIVSSQFAARNWGTSTIAGTSLKLYTFGDTVEVVIAAVFESWPENSHENFDLLILFTPGAIGNLNFNANETGVYGRALRNTPGHYAVSDNHNRRSYSFQPLTEIYFGPRVLGEGARHGDRYSVIILLSITALIFFLTLTTFINLTTITLPYRSKELAVKKLAGTTQAGLLLGFIRESFSIVGLALFMGMLVILAFRPIIEPILGLDLISSILNPDPEFILIVILLCLVLGASPVFMTLRFVKATPNRLLSTDTITFPALKRNITFIQLGISIFLIIASVVVRRQINYSLVKAPGQNHDQVVYLNSPSGITNAGVNAMRRGWREHNPNILGVMAISQLPDRVKSKEINSPFYQLAVDPGFLDFFELQIEEGYWFGPNSNDSSTVINKAARKIMRVRDAHVLGVVEDVNGLFNQPEKPMKILRGGDYGYNWLCIRVLEVDIRRTVQTLSEQFSSGGQTARVNYLSDSFRSWIGYQDRLNRLSEILTTIAGLLSCCAIWALSMSLVRDKMKQIAVHKLFGANAVHITLLLVKDFARQLSIAIVIFIPLSYILLNELLRTFVYATAFSWQDPLYPIAYCVVAIVAICAFQAWNLKRTNSIVALKG